MLTRISVKEGRKVKLILESLVGVRSPALFICIGQTTCALCGHFTHFGRSTPSASRRPNQLARRTHCVPCATIQLPAPLFVGAIFSLHGPLFIIYLHTALYAGGMLYNAQRDRPARREPA